MPNCCPHTHPDPPTPPAPTPTLPQRLTGKGTCGGMDSEDPTCARLVLSGTLRALSTQEAINQAMLDPTLTLTLTLTPTPTPT